MHMAHFKKAALMYFLCEAFVDSSFCANWIPFNAAIRVLCSWSLLEEQLAWQHFAVASVCTDEPTLLWSPLRIIHTTLLCVRALMLHQSRLGFFTLWHKPQNAPNQKKLVKCVRSLNPLTISCHLPVFHSHSGVKKPQTIITRQAKLQ